MEKNGVVRLCSLGLYVCFAAVLLMRCQCDAANTIQTGSPFRNLNTKPSRKIHFSKKFDTYMPLDSSNFNPDVNSAFDSLPQDSFLGDASPYCVCPPPATPGPILPTPFPFPPSNPNPPAMNPSPSGIFPYPPISPRPTPPVLSPPSGSGPSPFVFPPFGSSPPTVPSPTSQSPHTSQWCVAKVSGTPQQAMQRALDYACGSGADCGNIQPNAPCFQPNTLEAHASYAFNNYWQKKKAIGATCDFGGVAMLVTTDPSHDGCKFD